MKVALTFSVFHVTISTEHILSIPNLILSSCHYQMTI